jgi:hypothetical protein
MAFHAVFTLIVLRFAIPASARRASIGLGSVKTDGAVEAPSLPNWIKDDAKSGMLSASFSIGAKYAKFPCPGNGYIKPKVVVETEDGAKTTTYPLHSAMLKCQGSYGSGGSIALVAEHPFTGEVVVGFKPAQPPPGDMTGYHVIAKRNLTEWQPKPDRTLRVHEHLLHEQEKLWTEYGLGGVLLKAVDESKPIVFSGLSYGSSLAAVLALRLALECEERSLKLNFRGHIWGAFRWTDTDGANMVQSVLGDRLVPIVLSSKILEPGVTIYDSVPAMPDYAEGYADLVQQWTMDRETGGLELCHASAGCPGNFNASEYSASISNAMSLVLKTNRFSKHMGDLHFGWRVIPPLTAFVKSQGWAGMQVGSMFECLGKNATERRMKINDEVEALIGRAYAVIGGHPSAGRMESYYPYWYVYSEEKRGSFRAGCTPDAENPNCAIWAVRAVVLGWAPDEDQRCAQAQGVKVGVLAVDEPADEEEKERDSRRWKTALKEAMMNKLGDGWWGEVSEKVFFSAAKLAPLVIEKNVAAGICNLYDKSLADAVTKNFSSCSKAFMGNKWDPKVQFPGCYTRYFGPGGVLGFFGGMAQAVWKRKSLKSVFVNAYGASKLHEKVIVGCPAPFVQSTDPNIINPFTGKSVRVCTERKIAEDSSEPVFRQPQLARPVVPVDITQVADVVESEGEESGDEWMSHPTVKHH